MLYKFEKFEGLKNLKDWHNKQIKLVEVGLWWSKWICRLTFFAFIPESFLWLFTHSWATPSKQVCRKPTLAILIGGPALSDRISGPAGSQRGLSTKDRKWGVVKKLHEQNKRSWWGWRKKNCWKEQTNSYKGSESIRREKRGKTESVMTKKGFEDGGQWEEKKSRGEAIRRRRRERSKLSQTFGRLAGKNSGKKKKDRCTARGWMDGWREGGMDGWRGASEGRAPKQQSPDRST